MNLESLKCVDMTCVSKVPYKDEMIFAKLKSVCDGDTVRVVILLSEYPLEIAIRILGVDTPESAMRPGVTETEKKAGLLVKKHVKSLFTVGQVYRIILKDLDKYSGRFLGDIFIEEVPLSNIILSNNLGRQYYGEKKKPWDVSLLNSIIEKLTVPS